MIPDEAVCGGQPGIIVMSANQILPPKFRGRTQIHNPPILFGGAYIPPAIDSFTVIVSLGDGRKLNLRTKTIKAYTIVDLTTITTTTTATITTATILL